MDKTNFTEFIKQSDNGKNRFESNNSRVPLETASEVAQEQQPKTLKESSEAADAVTTDVTENNAR